MLAIPVVASVIYAVLRRPATLRVGAFRPFRSVAGRHGGDARFLHPLAVPIYCLGVGGICFIIALMRPQQILREIEETQKARDMMLLLDISGSMKAYDVGGYDNLKTAAKAVSEGDVRRRIGIAKDVLREFLQKRPNDRIGLVAFDREAYVVSPPTLDHRFLLHHLKSLDAGMFRGDGTSITTAVSASVERLRDSSAKSKVAVLFTDGRDNVDTGVTPLQATEVATKFGISLYTIGVGSEQALIKAPGRFGNTRIRQIDSVPDRELLRKMAESAGGDFFAASDEEGFRQAMQKIDRETAVEVKTRRYKEKREVYVIWVVAGVAFLLLGEFLQRTFLQKLP